jgi:hypothetical protein
MPEVFISLHLMASGRWSTREFAFGMYAALTALLSATALANDYRLDCKISTPVLQHNCRHFTVAPIKAYSASKFQVIALFSGRSLSTKIIGIDAQSGAR